MRSIGGQLLKHLISMTTRPVLIGTWADASRAVRFYEKHGLAKVSAEEKDRLLRKYWRIPERQVETPVVLRQRVICVDPVSFSLFLSLLS
ncbi:MAG: hypothetical protein M0Z71_10970 [Nitrospiraceae bacterium]|nr:hypothetical protein [Nitrospiraceae bacterium]